MTQISDHDRTLIGFLQKQGAKSVSELAELMQVTETAIRQRLTRLIALGFLSREEERVSRGRPVHKYSVTRQGRENTGQNFLDLASVVWEEVRAMEDKEIRSRVIQGIARRLAEKYRQEIQSSEEESCKDSTWNRAEQIARFFEKRGIPVTVAEHDSEDPGSAEMADGKRTGSGSEAFPILQLHGCPYPGLSERDDLICEMEQSMFSELAGCDVELQRCDSNSRAECCSFHLESHPGPA